MYVCSVRRFYSLVNGTHKAKSNAPNMSQCGLAHFDFASMLINWCTSWAGEHKARIIVSAANGLRRRRQQQQQQQWRQHHIPLNRSKFIICIYEEIGCSWMRTMCQDVIVNIFGRQACARLKRDFRCRLEIEFCVRIGIVCVLCDWMDGWMLPIFMARQSQLRELD